MSAFPEHKPALLKKTIGKQAFPKFSAKVEMTQDDYSIL
jgi:hypothetical protein